MITSALPLPLAKQRVLLIYMSATAKILKTLTLVGGWTGQLDGPDKKIETASFRWWEWDKWGDTIFKKKSEI